MLDKTMNIRLITLVLMLALLGCAGPAPDTPEPQQPPAAAPTEEVPPPTEEAPPDTAPVDEEIQLARADVKRLTAPDVPPGALDELTRGNTTFAFDLYQQLRTQDGNLITSPYSISLALAMTYAGARGQTEREMSDTLHFPLEQERLHPAFNALDLDLAERGSRQADDEGQVFRLSIANAIWGQEGVLFHEAFLETLALNYGAGLRLLDFLNQPEESRLVINDWVAKETEDRIMDIIPPGLITPDTVLVLSNAIYFNASWMYPFDDQFTEEGTFYLLDGNEISVPMMYQRHEYGTMSADGYRAVSLPYLGGDTEMIIIVPDAGRFEEVESALDTAAFTTIVESLESREVVLTMPLFEAATDVDLARTLAEMGMPGAFRGDADFSGIADFTLFISNVLHKAFIKVDESGTEAAAATVVIMRKGAMPAGEPVELTIDRPFIFTIYDRATGTVLFIGRVVNPAG